jgi:hypothetical protein
MFSIAGAVAQGLARELAGQAAPVVAAKLREVAVAHGISVPEARVQADAREVAATKTEAEAAWLLSQRLATYGPGAALGTGPIEAPPRPHPVAARVDDDNFMELVLRAEAKAKREMVLVPQEELADLRWRAVGAPRVAALKYVAVGAGATVISGALLYSGVQLMYWIIGSRSGGRSRPRWDDGAGDGDD